MTATATPTRTIIGKDSRPLLPKFIKLRHDPGRGRWVLLAPERVFNPDDTAGVVLQKCDGKTSVADIAEGLAKEYGAPVDVIAADITAMLQDLADKCVIKA